MTTTPIAGKFGADLRVGYILKMFPRLSETFILNELLELERQGVELSVYSLRYPNDGRFHGRLGELRLTTEYFRGGKLESSWKAVRALRPEMFTPFERWGEAAEFLRRHSIPGELDVLLRAVLIAARVTEQQIQHLHAHFATSATWMAAVVGMMTGIPYSFTAHAKDIFSDTVSPTLFAELVERAAFAVTVSDYNCEFIRRRVPGVDGDKVIRLYNGIDLDYFQPTTSHSTPQVPHVVSVGRLVPKKGFDRLLRALAICKDGGLQLRATIVGDGPELGNLAALRDTLGLSSLVELPGALPQERVRNLLEHGTFVALACVPDEDGNMDALPTVLLESLAVGLPIVSTRLTGVPEIVGEDGGILVEPGDDDAFAHAIRTLWEQIRSGARPHGAARARAERLFDLRKSAASLRGLYERSVARHALP